MIEFILWFIFGYWLGTKFFDKVKNANNQKNNVVTMNTIMTGVKVKTIPTLKTETHDGIIFAFNNDSETFISQGTTIEAVAEAAYKFRNIDLAFVLHNDYPMWFINGKVTTTNVKII